MFYRVLLGIRIIILVEISCDSRDSRKDSKDSKIPRAVDVIPNRVGPPGRRRHTTTPHARNLYELITLEAGTPGHHQSFLEKSIKTG